MQSFGSIFVLLLLLTTSSTAQVRQDSMEVAGTTVARKNAALAGTLSFASGFVLLPGMGSFYAGNSRHGVRHLSIGLGALIMFLFGVDGILACGIVDPSPCTDSERANIPTWEVVAMAAMLTYGVNYLWSIATAVSDVHSFNRRQSRQRRLGFQPAVIDLASRKTWSTSPLPRQSRIGLGLSATF